MKMMKLVKAVLIVLATCCVLQGCGPSQKDVEETAKKLLQEGLDKNTMLCELVTPKVKDCTLVKESDHKYKGIGKVTLAVKKGKKGESIDVSYNFDVTVDGNTILVSDSKLSDADAEKLGKLIMKQSLSGLAD